MADEAAVLDAVETQVNDDISSQESTQSTQTEGESSTQTQETERQDNRRAPDALRKHIADLRRQADAITDPVEKKAAQDRIKLLYDTTGKARGYEEQFPTVREAREVKAMLDAVGGREGFTQMQQTLSEVAEIDAKLSAGDTSVVERMWEEAPEGMPKLMPELLQKFEQTKPQEYEQFIAPRSIGYLDKSGFPQAFDRMVQLYEAGKTEDAKAIRDQLTQWVVANRQQAQQKQVDPEVERLRQELARRDQGEESQKVDAAYNTVVDHAGPVIDRVAQPIIAKLNFTPEEKSAFRNAVWDHLQKTRNENPTYKTIAPAKQKQGYDKWVEYASRWTGDNADASIRAVLKTPPWSRIQSGAKQQTAILRTPGAVAVQQGKEPAPSEIDYSQKGILAARKAGFKDLADMLLAGQAPLKVGGIRKWR